jgi:hypothetical protein
MKRHGTCPRYKKMKKAARMAKVEMVRILKEVYLFFCVRMRGAKQIVTCNRDVFQLTATAVAILLLAVEAVWTLIIACALLVCMTRHEPQVLVCVGHFTVAHLVFIG